MELQLKNIQNLVYEVRGMSIMLDFDLAAMYKVETRRLKEQVRRNIERFPDDFIFQLTKNEWNKLVANCDNFPENIKHTPVTPLAFTQEGVAMLSGVLRSPVAIAANIIIMRAFVSMRQMVLNPPVNEVKELQKGFLELKQYVEDIFTDQNDINEDTRMQLELINESLVELQVKHKGFITDNSRIKVGYTAPQYRKNDTD